MRSPLIREIPDHERPREKLASRGPAALSDAELLALFFGTGTTGLSAIELGRQLLEHHGSLQQLSRASLAELAVEKGIGPAKACQLAAVFEVGRRLALERAMEAKLEDAEAVYALLGSEMRALRQESLRVVLLNSRLHLIRVEEITRGSINESLAPPREILRAAVVASAYGFVLVHNHPSGDPSPSQDDRNLTQRIRSASEILRIEFLDHVIIGTPSESNPLPYYSFRDHGAFQR